MNMNECTDSALATTNTDTKTQIHKHKIRNRVLGKQMIMNRNAHASALVSSSMRI